MGVKMFMQGHYDGGDFLTGVMFGTAGYSGFA